ncbi:hypothetical protein PRIPAC_89976 [Pristionchus pacificus]|uniref:Uncharacterized protein n=1 Tax=Pristionchus pacificus TaxID=54126 RepID=A0A2A6CXY7_PRIPA|nr:hypothetical protein PRIPAC_89976 [Pristionchus pacificus]|eukprot:PDM82970.1 hypothetical protein PRIPAC_37363 [Pristionchus pacificus]
MCSVTFSSEMRLTLLLPLLGVLSTISTASRTGLSTVGQLAYEYVVMLRSQQQDLLDTLPASREKNQVKIQLIEDELAYIKRRKEILSRKLRNKRTKRIEKIRKTVRALDGNFYTPPPEYQRII